MRGQERHTLEYWSITLPSYPLYLSNPISMNKVIIINLNGRAYSLEEDGYHLLKKYLDQSAAKLEQNPDKDEILADLEQAIADKCEHFLHPNKTVVETKEVEQILTEMGPVETGAAENDTKPEDDQQQQSKEEAPKRLYQIHEGAWISGVCTGLAAYFNVDVTLIRIAFVIVTIITHGIGILAYIIMAILIPYAHTSEQKAEARGVPFNARELVERVKKKYAHFDKQHWREQKKQWKAWAKERSQDWQKNWQQDWKQNQAPLARAGVGLGMGLVSIAMAAVSLLWVAAIISVVTTGAVFGFVFVGIPLWLSILILICAFNIVLLPLRGIRASVYGYSHYHHDQGFFGILDAIMWFSFIGLSGWLLWTYVPQTQVWWEQLTHHEQTTSAPQSSMIDANSNDNSAPAVDSVPNQNAV